MSFQDKLSFIGLDTDLDNRRLEPGSYRFALNCRVSSNDKGENLGAVENVKGNKLVTFALPSGDNICISTLEDKKNTSAIYFVFNSNKNHSILQYFPNKNKIEKILQDPILNFNKDHLITGINLVDGNLLYWNEWDGIGTTDDFNPPRKINIEKANNTGKKFKLNIYWDKNKEVTFTDENGNKITIKSVFDPFGHFKLKINNTTHEILGHTSGTGGIRAQTFSELTKLIATNINNISALSSIFTATACGEFVELEYKTPENLDTIQTFIQHGNGTDVSPFVDIPGIVVAQNFYPGTFDFGTFDIQSIDVIFINNVFVNQLFVQATGHKFVVGDIVIITDSNNFNGEYTVIDKTSNFLTLSGVFANAPNELTGKITIKINIDESILDRIKYPPSCEPKVVYKEDTTRESNYLREKVFQFRTGYIYDDNEKSTLSSISTIPINEISCGDDPEDSPNNFIEIDFTEDRLNNVNTLSIIKKVELFVREGNLGKFKSIVTLEQNELGIGQNIFKFYNDEVSTVISDAKSNKLSDAVPLLAKSQEFVKNRIFDGGTLEDYDPECIDAKLTLSFDEKVKRNKKVGKVTGRIEIINDNADSFSLKKQQPIHWTDERNGSSPHTVFGGFGGTTSEGIPNQIGGKNINSNVGTKYEQYLPEGGFVVYLAGTELFAISVQNDITGQVGDRQVIFAPKPGKVYDSSKGGIHIREDKRNREEVIRYAIQRGLIFSTFEIKDVPPGKYVFRIASHFCKSDSNDNITGGTQGKGTIFSLNDNDLAWQTTSTYMANKTELLIEVKEGETVNIGTIKIHDHTEPDFADLDTTVVDGYVIDKDTTEQNVRLGSRMELQRITIKSLNATIVDAIFTDHNGFFHFSTPTSIFTTAAKSKVRGVSANAGGLLIVKDFEDNIFDDVEISNDNVQINIGDEKMKTVDARTGYILVAASNSEVEDFGRTSVRGRVTDKDGNPVSMTIISTRTGRVGKTDINGDFGLLIYGDVAKVNERRDNLIFINNSLCDASFDPLRQYFINEFNKDEFKEFDFIDAHFLEDQDLLVTIIKPTIKASFKHGAAHQFGLVYYDRGNRSTTVNTNDNLKLQIPFTTQKFNGVQEEGRPIIEWEIFNKPPKFATHYQWLRTKNEVYNFYLQWVINSIKYVSSFDTDNNKPVNVDDINVPFNEANEIYINIANIVTFNSINSNSLIGYTFEKGDRIRLIRDKKGDLFDRYLDTEIKEQRGLDIVIDYIQEWDDLVTSIPGDVGDWAGVMIEIYTPILKADEKFFFEFGQCFKILNPNTEQREHITKSDFFKIGDAYPKIREVAFKEDGLTNDVDKFIKDEFEDASISDFYPSRDENIGRINIIDKDAKQLNRPTFIRFSNKFLPGSKINGLSSFEALNGTEFPRENGLIQKLIWTGNVLLSIHEHNTISHYIQEKIYLDLNGKQVVSISDKVLDSFRILAGQNGTFNPESVTEHMGRVYFYDMYKGEVIRYSQDGLTTISDYRMKHFFADKSRKLLELNRKDTKVFGVYDVFFDEYILSFNPAGRIIFSIGEPINGVFPLPVPIGREVNGETVAFNEKINRWTTFYSFIAEYYVKLGLKIISFKDGKLYLHNENDTYNNFYDEQFTQKIKPVAHFNGEDSMKIWQNISIRSQHKWKVPEITNPEGQKSSLIKDDFVTKKGVHHAAFLRDENTPNISLPLLEGDELVDETLEILMENDEIIFSKLYNIDVYAIKSERTNK